VTAHGSRVPRTAQGDVPGRFGLGEVTSWLPCGEGNRSVRGAQVGYPVGGEQGNPFVQVTAHGSRIPRTA